MDLFVTFDAKQDTARLSQNLVGDGADLNGGGQLDEVTSSGALGLKREGNVSLEAERSKSTSTNLALERGLGETSSLGSSDLLSVELGAPVEQTYFKTIERRKFARQQIRNDERYAALHVTYSTKSWRDFEGEMCSRRTWIFLTT